MKWNVKLYLSLACVLVTGASSFAFGQSATYVINSPEELNSREVVLTQFFTSNPENQTSVDQCDTQNHCKYIDQHVVILDCGNEKAKCHSDSTKDAETFKKGYAHVEVIKNDKASVGWISLDNLLPLGNRGIREKSEKCDYCESKASSARLKSESHNILASAVASKNLKTGDNPTLAVMTTSKNFTPNCYKFITADGKTGEWGNFILKELKRHPVFLDSETGVKNSCPNFDKFSTEKKYDFYISLLSGLAVEESSCKEKAVSSSKLNPNGSGLGLFQMDNKKSILKERNKKYQKDFKIGEQACPIDSRGTSMFNPRANIKCAVAILSEQLEEGEGIINKGTYWNPLLPRQKRKKPVENIPDKILKVYPGCRKSFGGYLND